MPTHVTLPLGAINAAFILDRIEIAKRLGITTNPKWYEWVYDGKWPL